VGVLYGINVLGASLGALLTPWVLLRFYGLPGAVLGGVLGNLVAALMALAAFRITPRCFAISNSSPEASVREVVVARGGEGEAGAPRHPFALWMALYAASGFVALSLEILWFRIMDVAVKSIAFTFGSVLCLYLLGNAVGSLIGVRWLEKLRRPLPAFLLCQCLLLVSAGLAVIVLVGLPPHTPGYAWYFDYWRSIGVLRLRAFTSSIDNAARLYLLLPAFLYGIPTVLMGLSFPILQRAVHDEARTAGRKVGFLQAANIAGCLLGSLLVGLFLLSWLGTPGTLRLLLLVGVGFALLGIREEGIRSRFGLLAGALVALALTVPSSRALWLRLHGQEDDPRALLEEDATGVAALTPWGGKEGDKPIWAVYVNGKSNSILPFGGVHTALGAVPALMHQAPRDIAIVGLGSGDTAWGAGCRRDSTRRIVAFEIIAPQRRLLEALAALPDPPPKLGRFLEDPRVRHVVADGRNAIDRGLELYDVIEMDALFPGSAGSGNLYSVDFFERCRRKLRPGGLMATWAPTARVFASFKAAFPYVLEMKDRTILVGSPTPIPFEPEAWRARVLAPDVQAYLGETRAHEVLRDYLLSARPAGEPETTQVNRDLYPRDEFNTR
jgi:spermidine synthase